MTSELAVILDHVPTYLLVLFRISGIFILAPVLGSTTIPRQIKILLAVTLSLCIYPMLLRTGTPAAGRLDSLTQQGIGIWAMPALIAMELLVGYAIGYAASIPLMGMQVGGHIIGQQIGVGVAGLFNPETQAESDPVGELFFLMALAIFVILGGHRVMLQTLVGSFDRFPPGGFTDFASLVGLALALVTVMIELALRVAAPLLCLVFLETVTIGFISRTVPGLNIMSIGFAMRLIAGVAFVVTSVGFAAIAYTEVTRQVFAELASFFTLAPGGI